MIRFDPPAPIHKKLSVIGIALALMALLTGCPSDTAGNNPVDASPNPTPASRLDTSIFERLNDTAFVDSAEFGAGKGGVHDAAAYRVKAGKTATVYRVFDKYAFGRWWALSRPSGSKQNYRDAFAICPEWNALDSLMTCTLPEGARLVVGPGESAGCTAGGFPRSDSLQAFINSSATVTRNCQSTPLAWP
ncbi:MAG: hypothetical protein IPK50_19645 [Fibrobacterota bacterium]|nr:hypothetical protein [Fibrobacterota bacterium]QQS04479.1 MAG: hypothetical protein IPK50_19645 [Fibrobacterota bacterium]